MACTRRYWRPVPAIEAAMSLQGAASPMVLTICAPTVRLEVMRSPITRRTRCRNGPYATGFTEETTATICVAVIAVS